MLQDNKRVILCGSVANQVNQGPNCSEPHRAIKFVLLMDIKAVSHLRIGNLHGAVI